MTTKNTAIRVLTALLAMVMMLSTMLTVHMSAMGNTYYGASPSIQQLSGIDTGSDVSFNDRRCDDRGIFHGDRYGDISHDEEGDVDIRGIDWSFDLRDPYLGRLSGRRQFFHCDCKRACSVDRPYML